MGSIFGLLVISFAMMNSALSARIVGFCSLSSGSHYLRTKIVMEELASRGHEVLLVVSSDHEHSRSSETIPHKVYQVPFKRGYMEKLIINSALKEHFWQWIMTVRDYMQTTCESLLQSKELLKDLRNFDLIVYEGFAFCSILISELLKIPRVFIITIIPRPNHFLMTPSPVSYVPMSFTGLTDKMSFLERVMNLGFYIGSNMMFEYVVVNAMVALKVKYNITPEIRAKKTFGNDELVIFSSDFALEYPQPLFPGQIMAGPITIKKPRPLSADLESYVNSSGSNGFIIVSFGSYMETLFSKERIDVLEAAFGKLKQKVLWKIKNYAPPSLSSNIKIMEWLPQNDLLAHKNIRAFVSHVGHNSLYESAYYGVPVVAIPLYGDQFANAKKAEDFGLGTTANFETMDSEQLQGKIEQVLIEPRFKKAATHISKLMQDKPRTPLETTADWIEYVLRHGGARHLRPQVFNIPWYQYYLLDVIAFLVAMVTLVIVVISIICRCFCRLCCKRSGVKSKKE